MAPPARVLLVDDDPDFCEALSDRLRALGFHVSVADRGPEALRLCREEPPAIVLLDLVLPGMDGMAVLETIRREEPDVLVIVITGHGTIARAVEAMKKGAYDFVSKPVDPRHLEIVLGKAARAPGAPRRERAPVLRGGRPVRRHRRRQPADAGRDGRRPAGGAERGDGAAPRRERDGQGGHRPRDPPLEPPRRPAVRGGQLRGPRRGAPRVRAVRPREGAFTGAHQQKRGKLEVAHGGTVFLDEIGDIRPALQAKLLRVLQDQTFERVGRHAADPDRRPLRRRDQPGPPGRGPGRPLPPGPLLPARRRERDPAAASRAGGGRPRARPALPRAASGGS